MTCAAVVDTDEAGSAWLRRRFPDKARLVPEDLYSRTALISPAVDAVHGFCYRREALPCSQNPLDGRGKSRGECADQARRSKL